MVDRKANWITCGILALITLITRLPFRSEILYHWDSVNFALGIEHFDVQMHQPHPPGYVLYILLGRLFNLFFHDPNTSLVWISILFSVLAVCAIFLLGQRLFGREVGLVSAAIALTSPLFWFEGEVALSYMTEGFFVSAIALCLYIHLEGKGRYLVAGSILLGLAGGFRQNTLVFLFPLWLFCLWRSTWKQRIVAFIALSVVVACWVGAMFYLSGGMSNYLQSLANQSQDNLTISAAASNSLNIGVNVGRLSLYGFYALTIGMVLLPIGVFWLLRNWRKTIRDSRWQIIIIWILPSLGFYFFFVQQAGYIFTFLSAAIIFLAYIITIIIPGWMAGRQINQRWKQALLAVILVANAGFFLIAPPFLFGEKRQLFNTPSRAAIQTRNAIVSEKLSYTYEHFDPSVTVVLADDFDFRLPDYYLRDYQMSSLSETFTDTQSPEKVVNGNIKTIVLFNEDIGLTVASGIKVEEYPLASGENLRWVEVPSNAEIVISGQGIELRDKG